MENTDFEETQPYPLRPEEDGDLSHLEQTMPSAVSDGHPEGSDPAQTMPVPVRPEAIVDAAFEQTIPPPPEAGLAIPSDPEATVATRLEPSSGSPVDVLPPSGKRSSPLRWIALLGILALILIAAGSAYAGYQSGIGQRTGAEATQIALQVEEQFELGVQDMEARHFDLARQRFEYVIRYNPNYPGVTDKLAEVLLNMNSTATPTIIPTPTVTPTPDTRGVEELFSQAQDHLNNSEWTLAIDTLLALRKADLNFQPVWVDGGLYVAYRNRGKDKILRDGDLEGGIYDLTQAEQIGPLDADSKSYLTWASLYKTGASFWELDWAQAVYYFAQIAPALPNLRDGSGWTATERLRLAYAGYGDFLLKNGDACAAVEQYDLALSMGSDTLVEEARNNAIDECDGGGDDDDDEQSDSGESQPEVTAPPTEDTSQPPATEAPPTEPPATEAPPTEAPATEEPTAEPPPAEEPTATPSP
jgi:tetratricopeptide (TPR) repeat protein